MSKRYRRILLTGAAGRLGTVLRRGLASLAERIRVSDRTPVAQLQPHEEAITCDLSDAAAVESLLEGVDAVAHFGGAPLECAWEEILASNIRGSYNLFEAD